MKRQEISRALRPLGDRLAEGKTLPIVTIGNQTLRRKARSVDIGKLRASRKYRDRICGIVADMFVTLKVSGGIGLAAPQVGHSLQIFIMRSETSKKNPHLPNVPWTVCINPVAVPADGAAEEEGWEGCLSFPGYSVPVTRPTNIGVRYFELNGSCHAGELDGFASRMFQHELDHLFGKTILDHGVDPRRIVSAEERQKQRAREKAAKEKKG